MAFFSAYAIISLSIKYIYKYIKLYTEQVDRRVIRYRDSDDDESLVLSTVYSIFIEDIEEH
jgi:hypothetical protein